MPATKLRAIFSAWWPLAASWLFMGTELPMISAVMARLPDPKIHLAAYGGVVFPIALIIEAPIIMLLSTSTALSKDAASYQKIYRFMMWAGGILTLAHFLLAFTPLFYPLVQGLMQVPDEIVEPSRIGLMIMIPWTWSIAYRRFNQGVLIRFGHSKAVGVGTAFRLAANGLALFAGWHIGGLPGIVVGTSGIAAGVLTEALYVGLRVRPVLRGPLQAAKPVEPRLSWRFFYGFYIPLALTAFINLVTQPLGSAALSRMPLALESLAVWPVLGGFIFMWRSMGFAYQDVVVAQLDTPGTTRSIQRFTWLLAAFSIGGLGLVAATDLGRIWFQTVSGLETELVDLARRGLWIALLWPALSILQNYYQGVIVSGKKTWVVTLSIVVFMAVTGLVLFFGTLEGRFTGLFVGLVAFQSGYGAQALVLAAFSRPVLRRAANRDADLFGQAAAAD